MAASLANRRCVDADTQVPAGIETSEVRRSDAEGGLGLCAVQTYAILRNTPTFTDYDSLPSLHSDGPGQASCH